MSGCLRMARYALRRQVHQSLVALALAALALLTLAPVAVFVRAAVELAKEHAVPLGEVPLLSALSILGTVVIEELTLTTMRDTLHLWLLVRALAINVVTWVVVVAAAKQLGATDVAAAGLPICIAMYLLSRPLALAFTPHLRCATRVRRTTRELKGSLLRLFVVAPAMSCTLYVYVTVHTQVSPAVEISIMGLLMPLVQAVLMSLLARLMGRMELKVRRRRRLKKKKITPASTVEGGISLFSPSSSSAPSAPPSSTSSSPPSSSAPPPSSPPSSEAAGARTGKAKAKYAEQHEQATFHTMSQMSFMMVLMSESFYSTAAFATLALAESDHTFFLSLAPMFIIEVTQVALHVKARRLMSRVISKSTAEKVLGSDARIRQWLLHQELGEKIGVFMAMGILAIDKALGRDVQAVNAVNATRLAYRGLTMVLLELAGDIGKDLVSQSLGLLPSEASATRVALSPIAVAITLVECLVASFVVQGGLALGT